MWFQLQLNYLKLFFFKVFRFFVWRSFKQTVSIAARENRINRFFGVKNHFFSSSFFWTIIMTAEHSSFQTWWWRKEFIMIYKLLCISEHIICVFQRATWTIYFNKIKMKFTFLRWFCVYARLISCSCTLSPLYVCEFVHVCVCGKMKHIIYHSFG